MRKLTPTLTQSGLLAVLLQRQRNKTSQLACRPAQRNQMRAALCSTSHLAVASAYGTRARTPFALSRLPCLLESTRTLSSSNRFTAICGSNIPNESNKMVNPAKSDSKELWNMC